MKINKTLSIITIISATLPLFADFKPADKAFKFNAYSQTEKSIISAANLNQPIQADSRITVGQDGHLYVQGNRLRIFGTNLSEFPSKDNAEFTAKNLAAQGYNCIRFHHTDANWTNCFLKKDTSGKWIINKEKLDDFDYFFAELKKAGIYSNINLLTGRAMSSADGFPADINKSKDMKGPHSLGFWYKPALDYQKKYAYDLLTHVNPYTGLSYCEDPAVAIVEINNENGFLMSYLSGWIDDYKDTIFWDDLENQWNQWLTSQGYDYSSLSNEFNKQSPVSTSLIEPAKKGNLEQHQGAKAELTFNNNTHEIKIVKNGQSSWHVQYAISGLNISSDKIYTIKFSAKASSGCKVTVGLNQAHDPWQNAGFDKTIELSPRYKDFEFTVSGQMTDPNLRLIFSSMGYLQGKTVSIKNISMVEGGRITQISKTKDNKGVAFPCGDEYKGLPSEYKNLILNFLWEKELNYWTGMKNYLREEINCKALLMGTAMGCSTTCIQSIFDIIDSHAYWNHPSFPGNGWDASNYYVHNNSLTKADKNATLVNLAKYRVYGKPFSVSEYDHPYPNQFTSEAYPMVASFGSFQDWDCIFTFCSEIVKPSEINTIHTNGYFDQSKNPTKACAAPFAARIFRNFLVEPAKTSVYVNLDEKTERENLYKNHAWSIGNTELFGLNPVISKIAKIGIALDENIALNGVSCINLEDDKIDTSENQLFWNSRQGIYAVQNKNLNITITAPNADSTVIPADFITKGYMEPFKSSGDFAVFTAINENNRSIIFSCRWTGNNKERLKEYGKSSNGTSLLYTRDELNLTTLPVYQTSASYVLNSEGTVKNPGKYNLYSVDVTGEKLKKLSNNKELKFGIDDKTIWYILE